jgi:hypothetical protein
MSANSSRASGDKSSKDDRIVDPYSYYMIFFPSPGGLMVNWFLAPVLLDAERPAHLFTNGAD